MSDIGLSTARDGLLRVQAQAVKTAERISTAPGVPEVADVAALATAGAVFGATALAFRAQAQTERRLLDLLV